MGTPASVLLPIFAPNQPPALPAGRSELLLSTNETRSNTSRMRRSRRTQDFDFPILSKENVREAGTTLTTHVTPCEAYSMGVLGVSL